LFTLLSRSRRRCELNKPIRTDNTERSSYELYTSSQLSVSRPTSCRPDAHYELHCEPDDCQHFLRISEATSSTFTSLLQYGNVRFTPVQKYTAHVHTTVNTRKTIGKILFYGTAVCPLCPLAHMSISIYNVF